VENSIMAKDSFKIFYS